MPATPAWPPQSTPRLFVDTPLSPGPLPVDGPAAHYLAGVMRLKIGDPVKLFDDRTGEWLATAASVGKRDLVLDVTERLREREAVPDLWLCAAPIKKGRVDWLAEKACELGVDRLVPVVTRRTVVDKPNTDRLRTHTLFFADETGGAPALAAMHAHAGPAAILIGPEGGFDADERAAIRAHPQAVGIGLGPRILRAETAAAAAVALWMAAAGDWAAEPPVPSPVA
jgi:16S rRNA (uracil1498-N3)-methyltransferase